MAKAKDKAPPEAPQELVKVIVPFTDGPAFGFTVLEMPKSALAGQKVILTTEPDIWSICEHQFIRALRKDIFEI